MVKRKETVLSGMSEIAAYVQRCPTTVLQLIRTKGFPAEKIGGCWESDRELVDRWRMEIIGRKMQQI